MHVIKVFSISLALLFYSGCTPNPGRKLISKGEIQPEINISTGSALSLGLRYGVTDFFNVGISVNSLSFSLQKTLNYFATEPYLVFRLVKQKSHRPDLNLHYTIPITISTIDHSVIVYQRYGLTAAYTFDNAFWYTSVECHFQINEKKLDGYLFSFRSGIEVQAVPWFSHFYEAGFTPIAGEFFPLLSAGITFSIQNFIKTRKSSTYYSSLNTPEAHP
jgi:hypothetical protein